MCSVLRVSRSGFYKWLRRHNQVTERQVNNLALGKRIEEIFTDNRRRYGAVRIWRYPKNVDIGRRKTAQLLKGGIINRRDYAKEQIWC